MKKYVVRFKEICIADFEVEAESEHDAIRRFEKWRGETDDVRATMDTSSWWETSTELVPIEDSRANDFDVLTDEDWKRL
ncbi:MAG: hypothetical protein RSG23_08705 [Gordonibacter sp.]|uniref:hypothetical protein n=1 Tax=Gordonibacter sp. TaxID=1968902 RepID=UPI002FCAFE87